MYFANSTAGDPFPNLVGDVRGLQRLRLGEEHTGDVECDVATSDHCDRFRVQRPLRRAVRVIVVPTDKLGATERTWKLDAENVERCIPRRTGCNDHGIVGRT